MNNPTNSIYEIRQTGVAIGKTASRRGTTASPLSDPQFVADGCATIGWMGLALAW